MKEFSLVQFLEPLMEDPSYFTKRMFGGLAVYYNELMVFVLCEKPGDREWKGGTAKFDLWNGVLVCTSRDRHESLKKSFTALIDHPILGKWQYLPMDDINFEGQFDELVLSLKANDRRLGIVPGVKKRTKKKKVKSNSKIRVSKKKKSKNMAKKVMSKKLTKKKTQIKRKK